MISLSNNSFLGTIASPTITPVVFNNLFTGSYQVVQTDLGLTYGSTLLDTGGGNPVLTLSGSSLKVNSAVPIWVKCTSGGSLGVWTYSIYYDGLGTTPIMSGTSAATIALSGASAVNGLTLNIAAGTATLNNIWKATASGLNDQSGNNLHYSQTTASLQPIVTAGLNGKSGLLFDGVNDFLTSSLFLPQAGTNPIGLLAVFNNRSFIANGRLFMLANAVQDLCEIANLDSLNIWSRNNTVVSTSQTFNVWVRCRADYSNNTTDIFRVGASQVTGNAGNTATQSGRNIGAFNGSTFPSNMELLALLYLNHIPTAGEMSAFDAAVNSAAGYGVGNVRI